MPTSSLGSDLPREVWPVARMVELSLGNDSTVPFWRSYHLSGSPILGHPIAPILYPLFWLTQIFTISFGLNILVMIHLWMIGVCTYLLLRLEYQTQPAAAFVGAFLFSMTPRWIALISGGHWNSIYSIAWWSCSLLCFFRFWSTGKFRWAVFLGIAFAFQALTDLKYLLYGLIFMVVCSLYFIFRDGTSSLRGGLKRGAWLFLIAGIISIGIASIQLFPYIELYPYINRTLSLKEAGFGSLPIPLLLGFLSVQELYFPEWITYAGVCALILVGIGMRLGWTAKERFWAVVILISLLLCLGDQTRIFQFMYYNIPGFKLLRVPARWSIYALFGIALLAAWGLEKWLSVQKDQIRRAWFVPILLGLFYLPAAGFRWFYPELIPFDLVVPALILILTTICLFVINNKYQNICLWAILILDLWLAGSKFIRPVAEEDILKTDELTSYLGSNLPADERFISLDEDIPASILVEHSLQASSGYDSIQVSRYNEYLNSAIGCEYSGYAVSSPSLLSSPEARSQCPEPNFNLPMLKALNTRYVIVPDIVEQVGFENNLSIGKTFIYDIGQGFGRFFSVKHVRSIPPDNCLENLRGMDLETEAILEQPASSPEELSQIEIVDRRFEGRTEIVTILANGPGFLVRSETWAPGWKAWIDSKPAQVIRTDCTLQGIWVSRGQHEIRFEYLPDGYLIGRCISLITLIVLVSILGYNKAKTKYAVL